MFSDKMQCFHHVANLVLLIFKLERTIANSNYKPTETTYLSKPIKRLSKIR